ncbi:MAG: hypothetical protein MUO72_03730 [Bacteroidales bacterium]|nr:hypothetical protein [Bacteroidales bacterium]
MQTDFYIPEPLLFNPLKHYLPFIREFLSKYTTDENHISPKDLVKELKHLGTCVMDIYTGDLLMDKIFSEVLEFLEINKISAKELYKEWAGINYNSFRIIPLSDGSQWTLKYHNHEARYVHIFPARLSPHSFRIKANTLKSALMYLALIGKDFISEDDLNKARALAGLSPIREVADAEAVTEMIEILRR